jgi:hypothetical protein
MLYENAGGVRKWVLYDISFGTSLPGHVAGQSAALPGHVTGQSAALGYSLPLILPPPRQSSTRPSYMRKSSKLHTASPRTGVQASIFCF